MTDCPDAASSADTTPVTGGGLIDADEVLDRFCSDWETIAELAGMFLQIYPPLLGEVARAIEEGNSQQLSESAHSLKGSISTFSTKAPYDLAHQLQSLGGADDFGAAAAIFSELNRELTRLESELKEFLRRAGKEPVLPAAS